jgi:hypothetical protein
MGFHHAPAKYWRGLASGNAKQLANAQPYTNAHKHRLIMFGLVPGIGISKM